MRLNRKKIEKKYNFFKYQREVLVFFLTVSMIVPEKTHFTFFRFHPRPVFWAFPGYLADCYPSGGPKEPNFFLYA